MNIRDIIGKAHRYTEIATRKTVWALPVQSQYGFHIKTSLECGKAALLDLSKFDFELKRLPMGTWVYIHDSDLRHNSGRATALPLYHASKKEWIINFDKSIT